MFFNAAFDSMAEIDVRISLFVSSFFADKERVPFSSLESFVKDSIKNSVCYPQQINFDLVNSNEYSSLEVCFSISEE